MRRKTFFILLVFLHTSLFISFAAELQTPYSLPEGVYSTLEEVSELALVNNLDIQLAKFDAQFAAAGLDSARSIYDTFIQAEALYRDDQKKTSSSFLGTKSKTNNYNLNISQKLPTGTTLQADFDNQRSWTDSSFVTLNPAHESLAQLSLTQELGKNFFGIADRSNVKIAKIDIQNAQYTSQDKIAQALFDTQYTYWKIAQYLAVIEIRQDMLLEAQELLEINRAKIKNGIIEQPQLLSSKANVKQKEIDLILVHNELEYYINQLKLLLNLKSQDSAVLPEDSLDLITQTIGLDTALETAFRHRRDYGLVKNEIESKQMKLVMKKNNLWPEINLEASAARNGLRSSFSQAMDDISQEDNPEYSLGLRIEFSLQNRAARSEVDKAQIEKAQALLILKKTESQILIQIKDAVRNCNILAERAKKQEEVRNLQEKKLAAELKSYQFGRSDTDTIIRYQDDLLLSNLLYNQALLDYKISLIELSLTENSLLDRFWDGAE